MPKATVIEETSYRLPAGEYFPAKLMAVQEKEIRYFKKNPITGERTNAEASFFKWNWEFQVSGGNYEGIVVYADTPAQITNRDDDVVRSFAEALLGKKFSLGDEFDTDSVVGLDCMIRVENEKPRTRTSDGRTFWPTPVVEVLSASDYEPPF